MKTATMTAHLIGWTAADLPLMGAATDGVWVPDDARDGELLTEFAGRGCYQSWAKPNPVTATNAGYLGHILDVGHFSVLEHGTATFYITGVSRALTHELVRHRHLSYSQLSQRYVAEGDAAMVVPDVIGGDPYLLDVFTRATRAVLDAYDELCAGLETHLVGIRPVGVHRPTTYLPPDSLGDESCHACGQVWPCRTARTSVRKQARQAARAVLPNATETRIVVTGNYRAWRHFVDLRATVHADVEIRALAVAVLQELQLVAPNVFADYVITREADGTDTAAAS